MLSGYQESSSRFVLITMRVTNEATFPLVPMPIDGWGPGVHTRYSGHWLSQRQLAHLVRLLRRNEGVALIVGNSHRLASTNGSSRRLQHGLVHVSPRTRGSRCKVFKFGRHERSPPLMSHPPYLFVQRPANHHGGLLLHLRRSDPAAWVQQSSRRARSLTPDLTAGFRYKRRLVRARTGHQPPVQLTK